MKKIYFLSFIVFALFLESCKKDFLSGLAVNPNKPSVATVDQILPGVLTSSAQILNGNSSVYYQLVASWMGNFNYGGGYSFNSTAAEYLLTADAPQVWDAWYNVLTNVDFIEKNATSPSLANYLAVAKIMKAFAFQHLVDVYNKVPYTQAFKAPGNLFPKYDDGSVIYDSLVANIDMALNLIKNSGASANSLGSSDVMFGGNMNMWAKFGNTVKLRLLVRQSQVAAKQAYIKTEAGSTSSTGYLGLGEDAIVNPGYLNTAGKQNPFFGYFVTPSNSLASYPYIRASKAAMDFYKNTNDPRLGYFYATKGADPTDKNKGINGVKGFYEVQIPENPNDYAADPFGIQQIQTSVGSGIGPGLIRSYNQGAPILTAAESFFLQSEAALRGYISGDPQQLYQMGITASFEYLGIPNADALAQQYYSQSNVTNVTWPSGFSAQLQAILTQKWAALTGINLVESWNDWRRTGFPIVPLSAAPTNTHTHMPYRFYYPTGEIQKNSANYIAAGGDKIDPFTDKVFWMP